MDDQRNSRVGGTEAMSVLFGMDMNVTLWRQYCVRVCVWAWIFAGKTFTTTQEIEV